MTELLTYLGFLLSMLSACAGWFWEFSKKQEGTDKKQLTRPGKIAFAATLVVFAISLSTLIRQDIGKREAAKQAQAEKVRLLESHNRLATPFDLSHVEIALIVDNENAHVSKLRKAINNGDFMISSGAEKASPDAKQAIAEFMSKVADLSIWVSKRGFTGMDLVPDGYEFVIRLGEAGLYDANKPNFKWGIRSLAGPKDPPLPNGYTTVHFTIPESAIQIPGGLQEARSFYDFAGRRAFIQSGFGSFELMYLRIHARNRVQYPIFDSVVPPGKPRFNVEQGKMMPIVVPDSPPWVPK